MAAMTLIAPTVATFAIDDLLGGGRGGGKGGGGGQSGGGKSGGGGNSGGGKSNGGGSQSGGGKSSGGGGGQLGGGRGNGGGGAPVRDNPPPNRDRGNGSAGQGNTRGNSNGGRDVIIVPDRGRPNQTNEGRTGQSQYKGSNNGSSRGANSRDYVNVRDIPSYSDIRRQAGHDENVRISRGGNTFYQYRTGYYHHDQHWTDRHFTYPHYSFQHGNNSVLSPWYNYSFLPGYVNTARISFDNHWNLRVDLNLNYRWQARTRYDRRSDSYQLDEAVAAIDRAFDRDDPRIIGDLIPRRDRVTIRSRWERPYTIGSDDFYDMIADLIQNSRTRNYHIRNVQYDRGWTTVRVTAEHVYTDAWRNQRTAWHSYTLEADRRGYYQIVEFAINDDSFGYNDDWRN